MIQGGAELPVVSAKKAPRHCLLLSVAIRKSAGLIDQVLLPKDIVTATVVSQAK